MISRSLALLAANARVGAKEFIEDYPPLVLAVGVLLPSVMPDDFVPAEHFAERQGVSATLRWLSGADLTQTTFYALYADALIARWPGVRYFVERDQKPICMLATMTVDKQASTYDTATTGDVELWDILDTAGLPTGRVVPRNTDGGDTEANLGPGDVHRIVIVCVFGEDDRLLIQQRTWTKIGWPGLWDLSAGGSALAGETSQQAASRELAEEVGINVDFTGQRPHISLTRPGVLLDFYLTDLPGINPATLVLQADEVQAARWSDQREILAMIGQSTFCPFHESLIDLIYDVRRRPGELAH